MTREKALGQRENEFKKYIFFHHFYVGINSEPG